MGILTDLRKNKTTFIQCDCGSEVLMVEYDHEYQVADFVIYEHSISYKNKLSFWQKIKYCYNVLIHNRPYSDQIILTKKQLKELISFLQHLEL